MNKQNGSTDSTVALSEEPKSLFILGCPRSGTTFLASLLANTIYRDPVESHFITKYYKKLHSYGDLKIKQNFSSLLNDILNERPIAQWDLNIDISDFYNSMKEFSYKEIVHRLHLLRTRRKGGLGWGDKTPHYILGVDILYELFPESKFLYIVRDGRDVALSLLEKPWGPKNLYSCAEYWKQCNVEYPIYETLMKKKQLLFLKYEDLLTKTEQVLQEICEFLEYEQSKDERQALLETCRKGNYNKWKTKLTLEQKNMFESVAFETLTRLGYETLSEKPKKLNALKVGSYKLDNFIKRIFFLIEFNTIEAFKIRYLGKQPFAE